MSNTLSKKVLQECEATLRQVEANLETDRQAMHNYNTVTIPEWRDDHNAWKDREKTHLDKHDRWDNRIGEYAKYKNHGVSQDFKITHGFWENRDGHCRDCARGSWGLDARSNHQTFSKWGNWWAYCSLQVSKAPLTGHSGYISTDHYKSGSYHDWMCRKSKNQKEQEQSEYESAEPTFNEREPPEPDPPIKSVPDNLDITCCANIVNSIGSNITDTTIEQVNNCVQDQLKELEEQEQQENENNSSQESSQDSSQKSETGENTTKIYITIGVTFILSLIIISCIILSSILLSE